MNTSHDSSLSQFAAATALDPDAEVSAALRRRFIIEGSLTQSATRLVYLARDLKPQAGEHNGDGLVRLRVLPRSLAGEPRQVELFRLESHAAARLSHPNILKASEAEEMGGVLFCVEEVKPDARTLRDHLRMHGWMSVDETLRIGRQVADALAYAHRQEVLHLTLDPEKILLEPDGRVIVTGFGIGRYRNMLWAQQERSHDCTPQYISPEQILAAEVDQRSDLYLLGVVLYEMLTDRAPFESEDRASLLHKHLIRTPPAPHAFRPELSREVSRLVLNLLGKRPDERPYDAGALKASLEHCLAAGLATDEREEEAGPSALPAALPDDLEPQPVPFEPDLAAAPMLVAEPRADEPGAAPEETWGLGADESDFTDLSNSEERDLAGDQIAVAAWEPMPQKVGEAEEIVPAIAAEKSKTARRSRAAWIIVLLLLGGAVVWAARAIQQGRETDGLPPSAVAGVRDDDVPPPGEAKAPAPEPGSQPAPQELASKVEPVSQTPDEKPAVTKEDHVVRDDHHESGESSAQPSPAPPKPATSLPAILNVEPASTVPDHPPAGVMEIEGVPSQAPPPPPAPEQTSAVEEQTPKIVRKSGDVLQNTAIIRPKPAYPEAARAAVVKGTVTVEVTIDEEGSVVAARPISGPEPLRAAAAAAARHWKWIPTKVGRNRARVVGTITFHFNP